MRAQLAAAGLDWIVPDWPAPRGVCALATTRQGGVSRGPYATMNLGFATGGRASGDDPASLAANRRRLALFLPADPMWLDQVHGTAVADTDGSRRTLRVADAAIATTPGVVCAVLAADCLPVLLADRNGAAVGIAHCGWRGLAAGIIENAVRAMRIEGAGLLAWLGPAIGPRAFEVGADVHAAFCDDDPGAAVCFVSCRPGKWLADLTALARRRLARAGVVAVYGGGICSYSEPSRFFSYRRERDTGRMATMIWLARDQRAPAARRV